MTGETSRRGFLGRTAADAIHELCSSAASQGKEYDIGAELVLGGSTGPAPASPDVGAEVA